MAHPEIHAALARERHSSFLAQAQADHLASQARQARRQARLDRRQARPSGARWLRPGLGTTWLARRPRWTTGQGKRVVLRDGSRVLIRPVESSDAPLLADGFARLSPESRRMRFLSGKPQLSPAELRYFTQVDHHDHEAIGALNRLDGRGVGIARYIRSAEDPHAADVAITVIDEWHRRGLGTELLTRLSDLGRRAGIRRFTALVAAENQAIIGLLRNMDADLVRRDGSVMEYEIALVPGPAQDRMPAATAVRSSFGLDPFESAQAHAAAFRW